MLSFLFFSFFISCSLSARPRVVIGHRVVCWHLQTVSGPSYLLADCCQVPGLRVLYALQAQLLQEAVLNRTS